MWFRRKTDEFQSSHELHLGQPVWMRSLMRWNSSFDWVALLSLAFVFSFFIVKVAIPFVGWVTWPVCTLFGILILMVIVWKNRAFAVRGFLTRDHSD